VTSELQLFLLGKPRLQWDGQPLTGLVSAKAQALLFYLAVTGQPCSRSALAGLLWGDMPEETARANLRLTLSKLRKAIPDHLLVEWGSVAFDFTRPHRLDVSDFLAHTFKLTHSSAEQARAAVNLYRGDFLDDFMVQDAVDFETWMLAERERLRRMALKAWQHLAALAVERGAYAEGIEAARQVLALEPWHEEAHQQLMTLLAANGQRGAALAQYEVCRRVLADELAVEPSAATVELYKQIARDTITPEGAPPPVSVSPRPSVTPAIPHNLPTQLTPLIGRETERAQIADLLSNPECRLLTLLGPGGIGKTRLALAVAEAQLEMFPDGVAFVPLAGVAPAQPDEAVEALVAALANTLRYTFVAQQRPREVLLNYLADKEMMLILDNAETWKPAGRWLTDVLRRAPGVKLLVTSRERLGVMGEWLFDLRGLSFAPTLTEYASPAYPAVQLFAECARRLRPAFDLSVESAAVNRLCQLVEGSPLGIELAAQWTPVLSCAEIVTRLEHSLDVLSATSAQVGERHHSMRAVLDDSWRALTDEERRVFRHLSVFQGGFALAAAEQVAGAALPLLAGLADKSWLRRAGEDRYHIHELLRQYGAEQLAANLLSHRPSERPTASITWRSCALGQRR
jgi:DNA-binding SARP family transcriptional activator